MRTYSIYLILFLAGILASCEDFLDQSPKYNLTLENAVTDYNGAKNIINGILLLRNRLISVENWLEGGLRRLEYGIIIIRITI